MAARQTSPPLEPDDDVVVEVRRSRNRRRTVAAYREDDRVVVLIPARFTRAEEKEWVATMLARLEKSERRRRPSDAALKRRAAELSGKYLEGRAEPGRCALGCQPEQPVGLLHAERRLDPAVHAAAGDAVLGDRLRPRARAGPPDRAGHTRAFWSLVDRYPKAERAKGFLEGVAAAGQLGIGADPRAAPTRARFSRSAAPEPSAGPACRALSSARSTIVRMSASPVGRASHRPPAHVERLVADAVRRSRRRDGAGSGRPGAAPLVLPAEPDEMRVQMQRLGVDQQTGDAGLLGRLAHGCTRQRSVAAARSGRRSGTSGRPWRAG